MDYVILRKFDFLGVRLYGLVVAVSGQQTFKNRCLGQLFHFFYYLVLLLVLASKSKLSH